MKEKNLTVQDIIQIAGTRVILGAGIGLLLATRLNNDQRKSAGLALLIVGLLSTIPIAIKIVGSNNEADRGHSESRRGSRFEYATG